jgi:hypothetical protein
MPCSPNGLNLPKILEVSTMLLLKLERALKEGLLQLKITIYVTVGVKTEYHHLQQRYHH